MLFFSQLINGLQLGSIYALIALGYSMVYGIIRLLNFAHGDILMVGAYVALFSLTASFDPWLVITLTIITSTLLAIIIEKVTYTPLRNAPRLSVLITAIGVSILLQNLSQFFFGASGRPFPVHLLLEPTVFNFFGININNNSIITIIVTIVSMIVLTFIVKRTRLGKAMRAVSQDLDAARLMGVNVNNVVTFTFAVGASLAGIGSILYALRFPLISPNIGGILGLKAFVAAIVGGIGSIPGAMIGGYTIGILEVLVITFGLSGWTDGVVFLLLIIVLMFKPTGIMGKNIAEKV
ncbi:MAG: branched-chain amino acid ABC transporter permease [Defluviitaleaceae bacterium]|nr:branched-chain amino acid ABC transporter permease [Defluviitaleaceae bacterium]